TLVALVQTATALPVVLLALPAGVLADVFDRRRLLIASQVFQTLVAGAMHRPRPGPLPPAGPRPRPLRPAAGRPSTRPPPPPATPRPAGSSGRSPPGHGTALGGAPAAGGAPAPDVRARLRRGVQPARTAGRRSSRSWCRGRTSPPRRLSAA